MEKVLEDEEISEAELIAAIRKGTLENGLVPVLNGTAFKNKGVQPLLDAVVDFLPSPARRSPGDRSRQGRQRGGARGR